MLSKNKIKFLVSLHEKKGREESGLFIIEGNKLVKEFLNAGMPVEALYALSEFLNGLPGKLTSGLTDVNFVSLGDLKRISTLKSPNNAIATVRIPVIEPDYNTILKSLCIALDVVQDPGNLGTIIRTAAWFGIKNIVCSPDSVDVYNPKVIQSSMGAIIHTKVIYTSLADFLTVAKNNSTPVYGTLLEGQSVYDTKLSKNGVILLGNESKGISENLNQFITNRIMIPKFSIQKDGIDSLNVSIATAIICSESARRASVQ